MFFLPWHIERVRLGNVKGAPQSVREVIQLLFLGLALTVISFSFRRLIDNQEIVALFTMGSISGAVICVWSGIKCSDFVRRATPEKRKQHGAIAILIMVWLAALLAIVTSTGAMDWIVEQTLGRMIPGRELLVPRKSPSK